MLAIITLIVCEQTIRVKYQALFDYEWHKRFAFMIVVCCNLKCRFKVQLIPIRQVTTRLPEMTIIPS